VKCSISTLQLCTGHDTFSFACVVQEYFRYRDHYETPGVSCVDVTRRFFVDQGIQKRLVDQAQKPGHLAKAQTFVLLKSVLNDIQVQANKMFEERACKQLPHCLSRLFIAYNLGTGTLMPVLSVTRQNFYHSALVPSLPYWHDLLHTSIHPCRLRFDRDRISPLGS